MRYFRRPKFLIYNFTNGVCSIYNGDPPETPWEIDLGFYLKDAGFNPALNVRIFVSDIKVRRKIDLTLQQTPTEMLELKRPLDFIPKGEFVLVRLGTIKGDSCDLSLQLATEMGEQEAGMISADTRGSIHFSATFHICCDEQNSYKRVTLEFRPDKDEWASALLDDFTADYLDRVTRPNA